MKEGFFSSPASLAPAVCNTSVTAKPVAESEEAFVRTHAGWIVVALSIYAAFRVLVFAAAFPLFNPVDEKAHFLTIRMYAQGQLPGKELPLMDPELAKALLPYSSSEYNFSSEELAQNGVRVPLYELPVQARDAAYHLPFYAQKLSGWLRTPNYEAQSPPLYYLIAAVWYDLGAAFGIRGWGLAYWVRFLNPIIYALLVWLSFVFVRRIYPERGFLCIAVPALVAVFPEDIFFGMNRDVLSPLLAAAALIMLVGVVGDRPEKYRSLVIGSFLVGLAFLVEVSNCVLYGALAAALWVWIERSSSVRLRKTWVVGVTALVGVLPPLLWILRNYLVIGDLTGSKAKMQHWGQTPKPIADIFHHPLFSFEGVCRFLLHTARTFWRGEYFWHSQTMRSTVADWFYPLSSLLLVLVFAVDFVVRRRSISPAQKLAGFQALWLVIGSVLFMATLSVAFDYHEAAYLHAPTQVRPFFPGRIVSGALLPFLLIYAGALQLVLDRFRKWIPPVVPLVCLLLFITISEIVVRRAAFSSPYNFIALVSRQHG